MRTEKLKKARVLRALVLRSVTQLVLLPKRKDLVCLCLVRHCARTYKAVFDYKKIDEGFCAYVLVAFAATAYSTPERIVRDLAKHKEIERLDLITRDWELIVKFRSKDQDGYYRFMRNIIS